MVVLPEGFGLPPLEYAIVLVSAAILVTAVLYAVTPPIDQRLALGLLPWMGVGGALHAFYQLGAYPPLWEPLFGTPAVYVTSYVVVALAWALLATYGLVRAKPEPISRNMGFAGLGVLTVLFVVAIREGLRLGTLDPVIPAVAVVLAVVATALTLLGIGLWRTQVLLRTRYVGLAVVFAHALDGATTAIGADVLGVREKSPIPRAIMDVAADLPTADVLGKGWLFVLVKLLLAAAILVVFSDYVDEEPAQSTIVLSLIAAVGAGPATNNLFLFLVGAA